MAVKIRAKQSLSSNEYGKLRAGEYGYCKPSTAKQLVEWGMAEVVAENVEAPVKKIKEHLFMKGYEPKQESKPILYEPEVEQKQEKESPTVLYGNPGPKLSDEFFAKYKDKGNKDLVILEPEQAAGKKEMTDEEKEKKEQKETPKKQYK